MESEIAQVNGPEAQSAECKKSCSCTRKGVLELETKVQDLENRSRSNSLLIRGMDGESDEGGKSLEIKVREGIFKKHFALKSALLNAFTV